MRTPRRTSQRNAWLIAWALTLALHAGGVVGFRRLPPPHAISTAPAKPEPVRLVFSRSGPDARRNDEPHLFTELPTNRADARPEHPDFLSNVTSRARDRVPGGNAALPRMQGESDAPMVKLEPDGAAPPAAAPTSPAEQTNPGISQFQQGSGARSRGKLGFGTGASPTRLVRDAPPGAAGNSDIHQPEMDNPGGNAALTGEVSLNTTAWDYSPWLQRFGRQLMSRWVAPPAYYMGLLKDGGWAVVEAEISRSGELLRLDLLEERGHPSLSIAAQGAVRAMPPIEPLPADFPERTLILRLRMVYPRVRSR